MRSLLATLLACAASLVAARAYPCGGAFGAGMTIDPSQTILITHQAGVETYVFRPHFCGQAAQFGLILPIPATLAGNPSLTSTALFDELDRVSAPRRVARTECRGHGGADAGVGTWGHDAGVASGPVIIDHGQVGIFDWVLLKADSTASFTAWLDANGFPHDASADPLFGHYVQKGWFFVAFKVTAGESAPPPDSLLCGDLGPIQLSFGAATPVVPTRIAAASTSSYSLTWRIYAVAAEQLGTSLAEYYTTPRFSGVLDSTVLAGAPELAKVAAAGERLTKLDVWFSSGTEADLSLVTVPASDFRETLYDVTYVDCSSDGGIPDAQPSDFSRDAQPSDFPPDGHVHHFVDAGQPDAGAPPATGGGCSSAGAGSILLGLAALTLIPLLRRRR